MNLKQFKDQKGFIDVTNATSRTGIIEGIYNEVYVSKVGFEAIIPFEEVKNRNQKLTRKKPIKFSVKSGEEIGEIFAKSKQIFEEYSEAEYVEEVVSIDKAFSVSRQYSPLEELTPELMAADLDEVATAEVQYKRKAFLDTSLEAPKLYIGDLDLRKDALEIHDRIIDYCYEVGMNIENLFIFALLDFNRGIRDTLKLQQGATQQIQDVLDGKGVTVSGIQSSLEGINYIGLPKKVSVLDPEGKSNVTTTLLPENIKIYVAELNISKRPIKGFSWTHTPLRAEKAGVGLKMGNVDIVEYAKGYDVKLIDSRKVFAVVSGEAPTTEEPGETY